MNQKQLSIRINGQPVGILEQTKTGKMAFTYDTRLETPISLSMPIRKDSYDHKYCEAYFGGLLPESEYVKKIIGKKYNISPNNTFALLKAIGHDCAGAISCDEIDSPIPSSNTVPLMGKIISNEELYALIKGLPTNPLFIGIDGLRLSLAGVQEKSAVCVLDNRIALSENNCPTTHILKPMSLHNEYEGLTENEYFCMTLAKRIGLPVPDIQLRRIKDISFLLIERFDRYIQNNNITRIHQEDFCQALAIPSYNKYQNEGGPNLKNCFDLLTNTIRPAVDRNTLATGVVFNYLVGNMDAHGKNFSLLHQSATNIHLAPFYDIVCTLAYPSLSTKMAMKIGGEYNANHLQQKNWQQLCNDTNYRYIAIKNLIEKMGNDILSKINNINEEMIAEQMAHPIIGKMMSIMKDNIDRTLRQLG